ncbi:hypothetical protein J3E69DRAFT_46579 [Trichoderma sp. SZMC 28015]
MASSMLVAVVVVVFNRDATGRGAEINLLCYFIFFDGAPHKSARQQKFSLGGLMPTCLFCCLGRFAETRGRAKLCGRLGRFWLLDGFDACRRLSIDICICSYICIYLSMESIAYTTVFDA